jgi:adenosylhomocysteine nucleosidase
MHKNIHVTHINHQDNMNTSKPKIGIVCPAQMEYQTCKSVLRLSVEQSSAHRSFSSRHDRMAEIIAVHSGPGKIQSASATQWLIDRFAPDIILDVGGAGALSPRLKPFDIVCGEFGYEFDICDIKDFSRLAKDLTSRTIVPLLTENGKNILDSFAKQVDEKRAVAFEMGNIASGECNVKESSFREELHKSFKAIACNWESSAVWKTSQLNGVKVMAFRVITDEAGENMAEQLKKNWKKASEILFSVIGDFIFGRWLHRVLSELRRKHSQ